MSASKLAEAGMAAVQARKYDEAIETLSKAIDQSKSPQWLLSRSTAYMETGQLDKALRDAEFAYCTAAERGNDKSRKQMIEAQYRRSVIYFRKKRYADADACAVWSQQLAKGVAVKAADTTANSIDEKGFYHATVADAMPSKAEKKESAEGLDAFSRISSIMSNGGSKTPYEKDWQKAQTWRCMILGLLEPLPADDPLRKVTVKLVPTKPSLEEKAEKKEKHDPEIEAAKASLAEAKPAPKPETNNAPFRSQIYQSDSQITVTLFMKFASKEDTAKVQVDFQPNLITITGVPREPSTAYIVPHAAINPSKSTYRVAAMKIEFTLTKAQPGKWPSFGREELSNPDPSTLPAADEPTTEASSTVAPAQIKENDKAKGPAYPTSSKSGPKDWDKFGSDEKDEDDGADVNQFFKKLYSGATPDQQRAMMKSFQESNGTTLSTDWDSVSKETVKTNPPEGVEAKKW